MLPEVNTLIAALAAQIKADAVLTDETVMIGIHTGGAWVAQRLHDALKLKTPLGTLAVTLHRDDFEKIGLHPQARSTNIAFDVNGSDIILVDDVLYSGRTIRAALNEIFDFGRPTRVRLACLVDRNHRQLPIAADWVGATLEFSSKQKLLLTRADEKLELILQDKK